MNWYIDVLKKYTVFEGRARRKEYWMFILFNIIVSILVAVIGGILGTTLLSVIYALAVILPSIGVAIRRLHDTGRSGWWLLVGFIPLIGFIVLIVFMVLDSDMNDNQFGSNPKAIAD